MTGTINVTLVTSHDTNEPEIIELLNVERYLSSRVRTCVNIESRCMHLENYAMELGIFVNGMLIEAQNLSGLIDYLHLRVLNDSAA